MDEKQITDFIIKVVRSLQTDHDTKQQAKKSMIDVLNEADELHLQLTGKRIVQRAPYNVIEFLCTTNPLKRISKP